MTTILNTRSRLRRLVCSQHTIAIDDVLHTVYDLMLLNSGDIELLNSTIKHVTQNFSDQKWCGPTIFIQITVRAQLVNVPLLAYLNAHNFQDFGRRTKDFGDGGKLNNYCIYVNHPLPSTNTITSEASTPIHTIPSLDLSCSSSTEWVDPLSPLKSTEAESLDFLDCMPSLGSPETVINATSNANDSDSGDDELAIKLFAED